jgi:Kef-type K+ transport system membrane component KefB
MSRRGLQVVLALVIGIARPPVDVWKVGRMILLTVALGAVVLTVGRRLLERAERAFPVKDGQVDPNLLSGLLIMLLLLSAATSKIGIFAIFGAFLAGVAISHQRRLAEAVSDRLHDLTVLFFLPIFFTYTGLRADLTQLSSTLWIWFAIVTVAGSLANSVPAYWLSRRGGMDRRESGSMAVLINTPGLMALIVLNIGLDLEVIPTVLFSLLMASSLAKNLATTPILHRCAAKGLPALGSASATAPKPVVRVSQGRTSPIPAQARMRTQPPQG